MSFMIKSLPVPSEQTNEKKYSVGLKEVVILCLILLHSVYYVALLQVGWEFPV